MTDFDDRLHDLQAAFDGAQRAFASAMASARTRDEQDAVTSTFKALRLGLLQTVQPDLGHDKPPDWFETWSGSQSRAFAIDVLPVLFDYMRSKPAGARFSILDVGCGTGHGSQLLALLFGRGIFGYHATVTGIDIVERWRNHIAVACPHVDHRVGDIFDLSESWDIVFCSHTIEHVEDWQGFCRRLQELARERVFITAPFMEPPTSMVPGHLHSFTEADIRSLDPVRFEIKGSLGWGPLNDPPSQVFVAELPGRAAS